jgi:DNA-binding transcriptional LysR family regulator
MIARRVAMLEEVTVASPDYVSQHGLPVHPRDLQTHTMVGFRTTGSSGPLPLEFLINGKRATMAIPTAITVNAAEAFASAARLGMGIIQVPRYHVEKDLADGTLVELLEEFPTKPAAYAAGPGLYRVVEGSLR